MEISIGFEKRLDGLLPSIEKYAFVKSPAISTEIDPSYLPELCDTSTTCQKRLLKSPMIEVNSDNALNEYK